LGDMYTAWVTWKIANPRQAGESTRSWLGRWADASAVDPGQVSKALAAMNAAANAPLGLAQDALVAPANFQRFTSGAGTTFTLPLYTATNANAQLAINTGGGADINFSSSSMDTSSSHTFVQGSASGFYSIFSGGASGSFDQLNTKAAGSQLTVTGHIGKFGTLSSGPGGNWWPVSEVNRAIHGKGDAAIWDPNASAGDWDSFFGPSGSLARYVSQLVLVSDYSITTTSKASYSQDDATKIAAQASFGIWPFFSAKTSSTHETKVTRNSDSSLSITQTLGKGLIQIWGVTVQNQAS
jgi:hypothetical protein